MSPWFFVILGIVLTLFFLIVVPLLIIKTIFGRKDTDRELGRGGKGRGGKTRNFLGGFPTSFYTIDRKVANFKVDPKLFDFGAPKVTPNLDKLKEPLKLDTELAEELYIGRKLVDASKSLPGSILDIEKARDLFLPHIDMGEGDEEEIS